MKTHALVLLAAVAFGLPACGGESEEIDEMDDVSLAASPNRPGTNGLDTEYLKGAKRLPLLANKTNKLKLINNPLNNLAAEVENVLCGESNLPADGKRPNTYLLRTMVECALPVNTEVSFTCVPGTPPGKMYGYLGLHPSWYTTPCGPDCQEKVSACVIATTNFARQEISIDIASDAVDMKKAKAGGEFSVREGAYWGNIFKDSADIRGCYAPEGLNYTYYNINASIFGTGSQAELMSRTCFLFGGPSYPHCFSLDGTENSYFTNMKNVNGKMHVQACATQCNASTNGNYIDCKAQNGGTTDYVFTVRRRLGGITKKK